MAWPTKRKNWGYPKGIQAVYDAGESYGDRYTIIFKRTTPASDWEYVAAGPAFWQHGSTYVIGRHLGKKILWRELPKKYRETVKIEL